MVQVNNAILIHLNIPANDGFAAVGVRAGRGKFVVQSLFARLFPHEKLLLLAPVFGKAKQNATTEKRKQKGDRRDAICCLNLGRHVQIIPARRESECQSKAYHVQQTIQGETRDEQCLLPHAFDAKEQQAGQVGEDRKDECGEQHHLSGASTEQVPTSEATGDLGYPIIGFEKGQRKAQEDEQRANEAERDEQSGEKQVAVRTGPLGLYPSLVRHVSQDGSFLLEERKRGRDLSLSGSRRFAGRRRHISIAFQRLLRATSLTHLKGAYSQKGCLSFACSKDS